METGNEQRTFLTTSWLFLSTVSMLNWNLECWGFCGRRKTRGTCRKTLKARMITNKKLSPRVTPRTTPITHILTVDIYSNPFVDNQNDQVTKDAWQKQDLEEEKKNKKMFAIDNPLLLTILLAGAIYQQCLEETTLLILTSECSHKCSTNKKWK